MTITAIPQPLPGERLVELSPEDPGAAAQTWLRRPNLFPGRALTAPVLAARSAWASGHVAQRGQAATPGVVQGLEVDLRSSRTIVPGRGAGLLAGGIASRPVLLRVAAGRGLAVGGEDVVLARDIELALAALPVVAPPAVLAGDEGFGSGELQPRVVGRGPEQSFGALAARKGSPLPLAGVLLLQPVSTEQAGEGDDRDPCDRCGCEDGAVSYEDWRIRDGARLLWYAWPVDADGYALPPPGPQFRNRLAWTVFDAERRLAPDQALPWEAWGLPIALVGLGADHRPLFVDGAAVRRRGGLPRHGRLQLGSAGGGLQRLASSARLPALWQAQIEQLAEQVAEAGATADDPFQLSALLARLPPCGLLPRNAVDLDSRSSAFLPPGMIADVVPIAAEQLDLAFREAAPLAPFERAAGERIRLLVPVSQASWEPRLLETEVIDPLFAETLDRFLGERSRALVGRQVLREKAAILVRALRGYAPPVPAIGSDPQAAEVEVLTGLPAQPPSTGIHRTPIVAEQHAHVVFTDVPAGRFAEQDTLYAWVQLDPDHRPRSLGLSWRSSTAGDRLVWWGEDLITPLGEEEFAVRSRGGELPDGEGWQRLTIPAAKLKLAGADLFSISFRVFGGRAAFASAGVHRDGSDIPWLFGMPNKNTPQDAGNPFEVLGGIDRLLPFEEEYGVFRSADAPNTARSRVEAEIRALPAFRQLHAKEQEQLGRRGVEGFVAYLERLLDRADDIVDLGFTKVQADIHRIRQLVLDTANASRLGVSSALAGIAQTTTPTVSNERLGRFFGELAARPGTAPPPPVRALPPPPKPVAVPNPVTTTRPRIQLQQQTQVKAVARAPATTPLAAATQAASRTASAALIGNFSLRSTTTAERLKRPAALEALEFAVATRHEVVGNLLRLSDSLDAVGGLPASNLFDGIDLWKLDIEVPDPADPKQAKILSVPFASYMASASRTAALGALLTVPQRGNADEGSNFSDASDLTDRTVALLRQVEAGIARYRAVVDAVSEGLDTLRGQLAAVGSREQVWQDAVAEARHDVTVTRALILEEQARLDAINTRRAAVLKEEFRFAAYVRPRAADNLDASLTRPLDPGLLPAPVPECLASHDDLPDELRDMLVLLREAPARWFGQGPRLVAGLDRIDLLARTVLHAQARAGLAAARPALVAAAAGAGLSASIARVRAGQRLVVDGARPPAAFDPARLQLAGWQVAQREAAEVISLGDLIDGDHGRHAVSRAAADFFDRCSRVCGCLHGAFSAVAPALRLDWAETLSQFDEAPQLRNLASLPQYASLPFAERRRLQGLVDWLFDQVEVAEPRAVALVNDLVRICLLLAAHAPVGRIIAGRLPRPVTARPGLRIPLLALDPSRLRIGMQALISRDGVIVARAVVEDLGSGEASARVLHTVAEAEALDDSAQVQFTEAAALGPAPKARPPAGRDRRG